DQVDQLVLSHCFTQPGRHQGVFVRFSGSDLGWRYLMGLPSDDAQRNPAFGFARQITGQRASVPERNGVPFVAKIDPFIGMKNRVVKPLLRKLGANARKLRTERDPFSVYDMAGTAPGGIHGSSG